MTNENGTSTVMPVAPVGYNFGYGNGGYNNGFGFGGDFGALIILFLFATMFGGGMGMGGFGGYGGGMFPWLLASNANNMNATQAGFDQAATAGTLAGIQNSITTGFSNAEVSACNRAYNELNRSFDAQTATTAALSGIQAQLAQCCCDNRAGLADLKYTVATEACADRNAISMALKDVLTANTASTQRILDQLCQDKINEKDDTIAQLRQELLYARGQASQDVQTATLRAGQVAEVDALYNRLSNCPVPSVPVYGRQPIFTCGGNNAGCGCGCGVA